MLQVPQAMLRRRIAQPDAALHRGICAQFGKTSEHFVAVPRPAGGSLFHIHRDTRFPKFGKTKAPVGEFLTRALDLKR